MKTLVCPKCGVKRFSVNNQNKYLVFEVLEDHSLLFFKEEDKNKTINTELVSCLGCNWKGDIKRLVKYFIVK